ncbi:hypothetical protein CC1G_05277 [Coprinopsis cinerea okayama7|uniref:N-acetyltransferase domain-containing protein n=1 Tax=Coprinopsis cinerea (strain Okayama-7 / 130 / ATCC MYA-4618 / FGSC 9003) TaxID=240176 RepID=A8PCG5_COPC7|nr:hypothetical protein CC1G_05277 [Coprinopsis cinerea okayama7\|eukprot:XP_001840391.2 hypothetical protein CC1G_05277 [Coprinopsis cinerea okayama7\
MLPRPTIAISQGLEGRDEDLDTLTSLFEELQMCSADVANPELDLLTFATMAQYFGVITEVPPPPPPTEDETKPQSVPDSPPRNPFQSSWVPRAQWSADADSPMKTEEINPEPYALDDVDTGAYFGPAAHREGGCDPGPPENAIGDSLDDMVDFDEYCKKPKTANGTPVGTMQASTSTTPSRASSLPVHIRSPSGNPIIGIIYLINTQDSTDYLRTGELNIGVIIDKKYRRNGYALDAVRKVLDSAFKEQECLRVQAVLIDGPLKHAAMTVFMKAGFGHEGTRRRAFRSPYDAELKDVTYLGLLATDWVIRSGVGVQNARFNVAPPTLWDEMFARHQREREELLRWEEKSSLKRTCSTETIRELASPSTLEQVERAKQEEATPDLGSGSKGKTPASPPYSSSDEWKSPFVVHSPATEPSDVVYTAKGKGIGGRRTKRTRSVLDSSDDWSRKKPAVSFNVDFGAVLSDPDPVPSSITPSAMRTPSHPSTSASENSNTAQTVQPHMAMRGGSPTLSELSTAESDLSSEWSWSSASGSQWDMVSDIQGDDFDLNYQQLNIRGESEAREIR